MLHANHHAPTAKTEKMADASVKQPNNTSLMTSERVRGDVMIRLVMRRGTVMLMISSETHENHWRTYGDKASQNKLPRNEPKSLSFLRTVTGSGDLRFGLERTTAFFISPFEGLLRMVCMVGLSDGCAMRGS